MSQPRTVSVSRSDVVELSKTPWFQAGMSYQSWRAWVRFIWGEPMTTRECELVERTTIPAPEVERRIALWFGPPPV
jgi:hypothetical protein